MLTLDLEPELETTLKNIAEKEHLSVNEIISRLLTEQQYSPFIVSVSVCDGVWTAECDALGLVTEADSYEALTQRAWEIAPELAALNAVGAVRLRFIHEQAHYLA
jgi:predicted DNA-binding ribbon-helix-helix protein